MILFVMFARARRDFYFDTQHLFKASSRASLEQR